NFMTLLRGFRSEASLALHEKSCRRRREMAPPAAASCRELPRVAARLRASPLVADDAAVGVLHMIARQQAGIVVEVEAGLVAVFVLHLHRPLFAGLGLFLDLVAGVGAAGRTGDGGQLAA